MGGGGGQFLVRLGRALVRDDGARFIRDHAHLVTNHWNPAQSLTASPLQSQSRRIVNDLSRSFAGQANPIANSGHQQTILAHDLDDAIAAARFYRNRGLSGRPGLLVLHRRFESVFSVRYR